VWIFNGVGLSAPSGAWMPLTKMEQSLGTGETRAQITATVTLT
jgi:hypothetical protein